VVVAVGEYVPVRISHEDASDVKRESINQSINQSILHPRRHASTNTFTKAIRRDPTQYYAKPCPADSPSATPSTGTVWHLKGVIISEAPTTNRICFSEMYREGGSAMELPPLLNPEIPHKKSHSTLIECACYRMRLRRLGVQARASGNKECATKTRIRCTVYTYALCACCFVEYHRPQKSLS